MKKIISVILLLISTVFFSISMYIKNQFGNAQFEQILYTIQFAEGTGGNAITAGLKYCLPIVILLTIILALPIFIKVNKKLFLNIKIKKFNKSFDIRIFPICNVIIYSIIACLVITLYSLKSIGLFEYIKSQSEYSTIFEEKYVDPKTVKIEFPEKKRNLIYIFLESMEVGYQEVKIGNEVVNLIPNLEKIAQNNLSFSATNSYGGPYQISGSSWTIAGIVAQTAGIPLKIFGNNYDDFTDFLPGVTNMGDILNDAGYKQVYMIGSTAKFGGRDLYFSKHGNYDLLDYRWARDTGKIDSGYYVFWGYEDKKLFEFAKEELLELSKSDQPFNLTMLTVDTHAIGGYVDETCEAKYDYQYGNAIACSDSMVGKFISWVQKQDFYDNTTIVLVGDHHSMQTDMKDHIIGGRTIYNAFLNPAIEPIKSEYRIFNSFDMFPTILASLGATIEGNRLALGTNLFSDLKTLTEETSVDYMREEIAKKSDYYNRNFLKETYFENINRDK